MRPLDKVQEFCFGDFSVDLEQIFARWVTFPRFLVVFQNIL